MRKQAFRRRLKGCQPECCVGKSFDIVCLASSFFVAMADANLNDERAV